MSNHYFINENKKLVWTNMQDGEKYRIEFVRDDYPDNPIYEDCFVSKIYCWHRRYNIGLKHDFDTPLEYWGYLVRCAVPASQIIEKAMSGGFEEITVEKHGDRYDVLYPKYPEESFMGVSLTQAVDLFVDELDIRACQSLLEDYVAWLPVWMYDHSGYTISAEENNPFSCPWDSGQLGIAVILKKDMISGGINEANESNWKEKAIECIKDEVKTYNSYLSGDVYGYYMYYLPEPGQDCDDCWKDYTDGPVYGWYGDDIFTNGMLFDIGEGLQEALENGTYTEI